MILLLSDIYSVIWKESRSWLRYQGSKSRTLIIMLTPLFVAVVLPWQIGTSWLNGYMPLFLAFLVPTMIAGLTVPDSFAGEKERNTLPTLLASRLPDRAILFGKMLFGILLGWAAGLLVLVISLISANISFGEEQLLFYAPKVLGAYLGFSLIMATLTAGAGILISMRAKTVQEASQLLIGGLLTLPLGLGLASTVFLRGKGDELANLDIPLILLVVTAVLLVVTGVLVWAAMRRFQRSRLVFD